MYLARYATATVAVVSLTLGMLSSAEAAAAPKTNLLSQWNNGSDAAAIAKLGEMFTAAGGKWESTSIAGHTANTLAKLRADVVAGNAPPAVQLKGPEIAEWNDTGGTANMDELANQEGWDKVVAPELYIAGDWRKSERPLIMERSSVWLQRGIPWQPRQSIMESAFAVRSSSR